MQRKWGGQKRKASKERKATCDHATRDEDGGITAPCESGGVGFVVTSFFRGGQSDVGQKKSAGSATSPSLLRRVVRGRVWPSVGEVLFEAEPQRFGSAGTDSGTA